MFRQDRTNPSTAVSNWRGRHDAPKAWPSTAVSTWLNGGLFAAGATGDGYWGGGKGASNYYTINKMAFSDEAVTVLTPVLVSAGGSSPAALANSGTAGYWSGGGPFYYVLDGDIDKITFSNNSVATITPTLSLPSGGAWGGRACANSGTAGYWAIGGLSDQIDKTDFSDDATATITPTMSNSVDLGGSFANSGTAAYWTGGELNDTLNPTSVINKTAFSDDATAAITPTLSSDRSSLTGAANSGTAGYTAGGWTGSYVAVDVIDKTDFSDDATAAITPTLSAARKYCSGLALSGTAAYWGGGLEVSNVDTIDKTVFSNDATAAISSVLSTDRRGCGGLANVGDL